MVAGAVKAMTAESAQRAALGAGAIVMDVLAANDGRAPHEKIERIRRLRPDMMLLSGGTDGGTVSHVVELAQCIAAADPEPRLGGNFRMPLIFAGNKDARPQVEQILGEKTELSITDNLRPVLEKENLTPARLRIHDIFLEHVMRQAPGYAKLMEMTHGAIMPTPAAVGVMIESFAREKNCTVLAADIGGATTDLFSVFGGEFSRTVSANLGMSYSVANVLAEAGADNVLRWLPFEIDETDLRDRLKNKMIRPTTIPQTIEELTLEHAVAREALRLAFEQHRALACGLKGISKERTISDVFAQPETSADTLDLMRLDIIIGSGGILAHAPRRVQAMLMMIDAFQPQGITALAVDSVFMMPHLGALSELCSKAALDVFYNDCLVEIGTCIAPAGISKPGETCLDYEIKMSSGEIAAGSLDCGGIAHIPCFGTAMALLKPAKHFDMGQGSGKTVTAEIKGGMAGIMLDGRGRPFSLPADNAQRRSLLSGWYKTLGLYPEHA